MQKNFDINKVDKQRLNKKLEEKKFESQEHIEFNQTKETFAEPSLKIETDDDFNFFYRSQSIQDYSDFRSLVAAKYKENNLEIEKKKAISCNINFLKNKAVKDDTKVTNFYENAIFKFFKPSNLDENSVDEAILLFLLEQEIDLNFKSSDCSSKPTNLESFLCKMPKNKNVIKKLLEKDLSLYCYEENILVSDLLQLCIEGEDLTRANEILNKEEYKLADAKNIEKLKTNGKIELDFVDSMKFDRLSILLTRLLNHKNTKEEKIEFLSKILYSDKVKTFDVANFYKVSKIYSDKEYIEFLDYMKSQLESGNVIAYTRRVGKVDIIKRVYSDVAYNKGMSYIKG